MGELVQSMPPAFLLALIFTLGLAFGSFATCAAWRIPRGKNFITGHSRCPKCNTALGIPDLIPLFSWLILRGKCRHCGVKFGSAYILIELATAVLVTAVYLQYGLTAQAFVLMALAVCIVILSVIDFERCLIPDGVNIAMFILAVVYEIVIDASPEHFLIAPVAGVTLAWLLRQLMFVWKKQEGLGLGDVKLAASLGMFLDLERITAFLFLSGVLGIVTAIVWKALGKGRLFPFGPALCLALFLCLVTPELSTWWQASLERFINGRL